MQSMADAERVFHTIDEECARANGGRGRAWCDDAFPAAPQVCVCAVQCSAVQCSAVQCSAVGQLNQ